jgi:hypothetical protein
MRLRLLLSRSLCFLRVTFIWILLIPYALHITGAILNDLVMFANGGRFPVMYNPARQWNRADANGMLDKTHCIMTSKTHLNLLADVIDRNEQGISSIGDILIDAGETFSSSCTVIWFTIVVLRLKDDSDLYNSET